MTGTMTTTTPTAACLILTLALAASACGRTDHLAADDAAVGADSAAPDGGSWPDTLLPEASAPDVTTTPPGAWISIKAGAFFMGSPSSEPCRDSYDERQHMVVLTRGFEIYSTEVTQGEFRAALGYNPSGALACGLTCPVERVSWSEAAAFCNALSKAGGLASCYACKGSGAAVTCTLSTKTPYLCAGYRLPTEAEFEYAARAGTQTPLYGGQITSCHGADAVANKIGWYDKNSGGAPHPAAGKQANPWGLYDMVGNVGEWVSDWYAPYPWGPKLEDPAGPASGTFRVLRFGSFSSEARTLRSASRSGLQPHNRATFAGFRCVRTTP